MGLKYVETIKSIILLFLVLLSCLLTFMIWEYEPDYKELEEPKADNVMISAEKEIQEVVKPYKLLYQQEERLLGTVSNVAIEQLLTSFEKIELDELVYSNSNLLVTDVNKILTQPHHVTLFFTTDVPFEVFNELFSSSAKNAPNIVFNRLVINLGNIATTNEVEFLFVSSNSQTVYKAVIDADDAVELNNVMQAQQENMFVYEEFVRENELSLYLPKDSQEVIQFTYVIDGYSHELFNSVLFSNPSIVKRSLETTAQTTLEQYSDDMAVVIYDTEAKIMNYISLANNRYLMQDPASLLQNSFNFVNDHGGFSTDYRLSAINPSSNVVEYQMYFQGYPVYSTFTLTRIVTTWGETQINGYRRPYYFLDTDITTVKTVKEILSGADVMNYLHNQNLAKVKIDEVFVGYHLAKDPSTNVFILEPSWFALSEGNWIRITSDTAGGDTRGLE